EGGQPFYGGGVSAGTVIRENGAAPGYAAFHLKSAEILTVKISEYTGNLQSLNFQIIYRGDGGHETPSVVVGPREIQPGTSITTPELARGFYVIEATSPAGAPRGRVGFGVKGQHVLNGLSVGGWLDAVTDDPSEGFIAFGVRGGRGADIDVKVNFGQTHGALGADRPHVALYRRTVEGDEPAGPALAFAENVRISISDSGEESSDSSSKPIISDDGRFILFTTDDREVMPRPGVSEYPYTVLLYARESNQLTAIMAPPFPGDLYGDRPYALSGDGRLAAICQRYWGPDWSWSSRKVDLYDTETARLIASLDGAQNPSLSGDGGALVYSDPYNRQIFHYDMETETATPLPLADDGASVFPHRSIQS
ncbi:MAG: hypothetical protein GY859_13460, partial [Desulfobacterales bacterium]|nr:hypothetical protein [Desulfobacterales bacterium]